MLGLEREFTTRDFCDRVQQVTKEEIVHLADKLFRTSQLNLAVIGPESLYHDLEKITNHLGLPNQRRVFE